MLISANKNDKSNTKYRCDMCKTKISTLERITINTSQGYENFKKKWDLCKKCFKKVEKAVENYYSRKERRNDT